MLPESRGFGRRQADPAERVLPRLVPPAPEGIVPALRAAPFRKFKRYPIGYFHINIAEIHTDEGRLYLLVAIDRTSKFAFVELHEKATRRVAGNLLRALAAAVPYKVPTVLTDRAIEGAIGSSPMARGTHFTDPKGGAWTLDEIKALRAENAFFRAHAFEFACADLDIEHRLTKPRHP